MRDFEACAEPLQDWLNGTEVKVQESSARLHDLTAKTQELGKLQVRGGGVWEESGRSLGWGLGWSGRSLVECGLGLGGVWEESGGVWEESGRSLGGVWEESGGVWEECGRSLGGVWEGSGRSLGGVWTETRPRPKTVEAVTRPKTTKKWS